MSFANAIFPSMPPATLSDSPTKLSDFASQWTNTIKHTRAHTLMTPPHDSDKYNMKHWLEHWTGAWANIDSLAKEASSEQLEIPSTNEMVTKLLREAMKSEDVSQLVDDVSMGNSTAGVSGSWVQSHRGGSALPKGKNKSKEVFDGVEILTTNWSLLLPPKPSQPTTAAKMPPCVFHKVNDTIKTPVVSALTLALLEGLLQEENLPPQGLWGSPLPPG
ncbi:hypothetical protein F5J12DRAFT_898175 [Pisolithus orientalis]|uniref:uncharacterized protein n=1 Tax=Pisolithus orientalis TaxID=936130 RepID=UPI002225AB6F|nr:uncharacterized protein F5J12DRAFT_898175 [Pisolithus orientalis]KAI5988486.1 hypothetical protein F5J12DRAFT_898175 [Pisolithus orientalis]